MKNGSNLWPGRFDSQVAVVTGAATGLGEGIAHRLACEGAQVILADLNAERARAVEAAMKSEGLAAISLPMDVGDEASVIAGASFVREQFGTPHVVVHCAGIVGPTATKVTEYETSSFDWIMAINLRGSFLVAKSFIGPMAERGYGRLLLMASIAGKEGNPGMCGYSVTKAGVIGLVKSLGKEYAETGVTVNGMAPAVVITDLVRDAAPEQVEYMTARIPMGRCGTIEEVAAQAAWIVSRECSFSTGFTYDLSGGRATY
jgi:3-oxoacyl-[acyl-carrier protein] reductase